MNMNTCTPNLGRPGDQRVSILSFMMYTGMACQHACHAEWHVGAPI
jgi:hypothetical protein